MIIKLLFVVIKLINFTIRETEYDSCTTAGSENGMHWCPYDVDINGEAIAGRWDDCDPSGIQD